MYAHIDVVSTLPLDPFPSLALVSPVSLFFFLFFVPLFLFLRHAFSGLFLYRHVHETLGGSTLDGSEYVTGAVYSIHVDHTRNRTCRLRGIGSMGEGRKS